MLKTADLDQGFERLEKKIRILTPNPWLDVEFNKMTAFGREPGFRVDDIPERLGLVHEDTPVSLSGKELLDGSVTSRKLFDKSVLNSKLRDACVTANKIADEAITEAKIAAAAITAVKTSLAAINATDGTLNTNSVGSLQIQDDAVIEAKVLNDAITATKIAVAALDGITGAIASDHIIADMLQTDCVTEAKVLADAITALKIDVAGLDGTTGNVATNHIIAGMLQDNAVTEGKVLADAITATKINVSGLDGASGDVAANHIVAGMIQTNAITSIKILADAVTASKINVVGLDGTSGRIVVADATDANEVTAGINASATTLIAPGKVVISGAVNLDDWRHATDVTYIDGGKVYTNSITATQIAALTITAAELGANCVTAVKILADAVTASKINVVGLDGTTGRIIVADVTDANVVAGGINSYATTLIAPGKVLISGATVLSDWSHGTDATLIDGGEIYTNSITATQIAALTITAAEIAADAITGVKILAGEVTANKLSTYNFVVSAGTWASNDPDAGKVSWTDVKVVYDGTESSITNGNTTDKFIYWESGSPTVFSTSNSIPTLGDTDFLVAMNYSGSHALVWNSTLVDGGRIKTGTITATNIVAGTITATELGTGCVTAIKIGADQVTAEKINVVGLDGATGRIVVTDQTDADEITDGINTHAVTLIQAGKVLISGAVNLDDWRSGVDATYIDGGKIYAQSITADQILAGTITADEIHAGTITADNLVAGLQVYWYSKASATLKNSNDTALSHLSTTYIKEKEIKINEITGGVRVYFEMKSLNGDPVWGRIYKNGVAVGTERVTDLTTYQNWSEDFADWAVDDLIQIYSKATDGERVYIQNMRFKYDRAVSIVAGEQLSTPLTTVDQTAFSVTNQDP